MIEKWSALIVLVLAVLAAIGMGSNAAWLGTSTLIAIYSLLALSVGITYGQAGILSVAQGAFASMGAYATGILTARYGISPFLTLPVSVLLPALVALPLARLVSPLSPLVLAIATLMFATIVEILLRGGGDLTGGYIGLSGIPPLFDAQTPVTFNLIAWFAVVVVVFLYANLMNSAWGRAINTVRHDPMRAVADGTNVTRLQSLVFTLGAGMAGLAGWLYAHQLSFISPDLFGIPVSINAILMAVVGGAGVILGPVAGAVVLSFFYEFLPGQESRGMFYGAALILTLVVAPSGLLGFTRFRRRSPAVRRGAVSAGAVPGKVAS
ncbi:branched-chain amino acid ABC transporter permease [Microvirga pudoricolor]|uniref:branched-chain amino acid ABC transporter permease n=1 Tax=Microvirga pudoricolor TaxID=2778729 RepID=UPI0019523A5C|nr:branched-chain amino acid ABC transporter permease [Microvirga pudoricolor]MBM6594864.1 branched-chain amino acid ABC transporter permease [Microvirga pudoricolor]